MAFYFYEQTEDFSYVILISFFISFLYKFALQIVGDQAGLRFRSGTSQLYYDRPISSGQQTYDTNKVEWPVTEPMKKLEANAQVC